MGRPPTRIDAITDSDDRARLRELISTRYTSVRVFADLANVDYQAAVIALRGGPATESVLNRLQGAEHKWNPKRIDEVMSRVDPHDAAGVECAMLLDALLQALNRAKPYEHISSDPAT
jgi:hypothetical protein